MNWEKAILKIDVVGNKKDIISEINRISKNSGKGVGNINDLIANHIDDDEYLSFIKRYAEIQLTSYSIHFAIVAFIITLVALLLTVAALYSPEQLDAPRDFILKCIIVAIIVLFLLVHYGVTPHINRYRAIITAIEAAELDKRLRKKHRCGVVFNDKYPETIACVFIIVLFKVYGVWVRTL